MSSEARNQLKQSNYLINNEFEQLSFFEHTYKSYRPFSRLTKKIGFDSTFDFGKKISINLSENANYGDLITTSNKNYESINKDTTDSFFDLANIQIIGDDKRSRLNIFQAKKRNFPLKINMLENHPFSSQVFLPFNATGFLVLVAPIGNKPKIDLIEIFKVSGGDGINFNPKVWHFPLISLENEKYITIDKKDADNNIEIYNFEQSEIFELNYE